MVHIRMFVLFKCPQIWAICGTLKFQNKNKYPLCDNVNEFMFASWRISYTVVDKKLFFFLEPLIRPHNLDLVSYHKLKIGLESGPSQRGKKKEWILEMLQHIPRQFPYPAEHPPLYEHRREIDCSNLTIQTLGTYHMQCCRTFTSMCSQSFVLSKNKTDSDSIGSNFIW